MRPRSLPEVAIEANSGRKTFAISIDEFLDTFYLAHPDKPKQRRMIDEAPDLTDDVLQHAWMGAVGEHVAKRWARKSSYTA